MNREVSIVLAIHNFIFLSVYIGNVKDLSLFQNGNMKLIPEFSNILANVNVRR